MKKFFFGFVLIFLFTSVQQISAQGSAAYIKQKITVGVDVFTDVWTNVPSTFTTKVLNPSANVYLSYNFPVGNKKKNTTTFSLGVGIGTHSLVSKTDYIKDVKADTIQFIPATAGLMKQSKMTITSLDIPMELKFQLKKGFHVGIGLKISLVFDSKEAYSGTLVTNGPQRKIKSNGIYQLNNVGYSPTLRFGYKGISFFASYQLVSTFKTGHGPALHPISLGVTFTPF